MRGAYCQKTKRVCISKKIRVPSNGNGKDARICKLKLTFIVAEARIEARIWMLDTRISSFELLASIPASSPITD